MAIATSVSIRPGTLKLDIAGVLLIIADRHHETRFTGMGVAAADAFLAAFHWNAGKRWPPSG